MTSADDPVLLIEQAEDVYSRLDQLQQHAERVLVDHPAGASAVGK